MYETTAAGRQMVGSAEPDRRAAVSAVKGGVSFRILVDLDRGQVVAIFPDGAPVDLGGGKKRKSKIDIKLVGPLRPAGGPDSGNCDQQGD